MRSVNKELEEYQEQREYREPNPLQQFLDLLVQALRNRPVNENSVAPIITFKDFKNVGPLEFKGTIEPIEAQVWVIEMEKVFKIVRVGEDQKTIFAT